MQRWSARSTHVQTRELVPVTVALHPSEATRARSLCIAVQIGQLLRVLRAKCEELEALKGAPAELQQSSRWSRR
jgi:hypothetical protein